MALNPQPRYGFEDWLADERARPEGRTEYVAGEIFAMVGASEPHNLIVGNILASLHGQMKGRPCRVYANDLRVRIEAADACCYPDVLVVCGEVRFQDGRRDVVLNPVLIVEVLSPSTEAYDRGDKFALYRHLPSLRAYLLVSQRRMHAELYTRGADGRWQLSDHDDPGDPIPLEALECALSLAEVYDKVDFSAA